MTPVTIELRALACAVLLQAFHDALSRSSYALGAHLFLIRDGGGVWADGLGLGRQDVRDAYRKLRLDRRHVRGRASP